MAREVNGHEHLLVLLPLATNLASLVASLTLLIWVWRLKKTSAQKLMARQLWHLALADVLVAIGQASCFGLELQQSLVETGVSNTATLSRVCTFSYLSNVPALTSVFIEVHIALATLFTFFRWYRALRTLAAVLCLVWFFGFAAGGWIVWNAQPHWKENMGLCNSETSGFADVKACIILVAVGVCVAVYLVGVVATACRPEAALQRRARQRAQWFLVAAVLPWLPFVVFAFTFNDPDLVDQANQTFYYVACSFFSFNGLLNAAVYAVMTNFVSRRQRRAAAREREAKRCAFEAQRSRDQSPRSFLWSAHAAFDSNVEELSIPAATASANRIAEEETVAATEGACLAAAEIAWLAEFGSGASESEDDDVVCCFDEPTTLHVLQGEISLPTAY